MIDEGYLSLYIFIGSEYKRNDCPASGNRPWGQIEYFPNISAMAKRTGWQCQGRESRSGTEKGGGNPSSPAASSTLEKPASTGIREVIGDSQEYASTSAVTALKWVNYEETAVVAGRNIGGMVYLGPDQRRGGLSATWRPTIVPTLPVAASVPDISGDSMTYWPGYSEISPSARAAYLDWLATGRSDRRYGVGHVFLYFYGLERRFLLTHQIRTNVALSSTKSTGCSRSTETTGPSVDTSSLFLTRRGRAWRLMKS